VTETAHDCYRKALSRSGRWVYRAITGGTSARTFRETTEVPDEQSSSQPGSGTATEDGPAGTRPQRAASHQQRVARGGEPGERRVGSRRGARTGPGVGAVASP